MTETQKPKPLDMRAVSSVSFGDLLRTISPEIASQIALRKCSEEVGGGGVGRGGRSKILMKRMHAIEDTSLQKVAAGHKEQMSPSRITVLF